MAPTDSSDWDTPPYKRQKTPARLTAQAATAIRDEILSDGSGVASVGNNNDDIPFRFDL